MTRLRRFCLRLFAFFRPGRAERQLGREIDAHLALLQQGFEDRGMSSDEARHAARRAFGGIEQAKELQRDERSFPWLEDLRRDLWYAARTLRRTPGFTAVAVITLALGIGAVTIIYSVLRYVILDPFPYSDSHRMVDVVLRDPSGRNIRGPAFPAAEFLDYQEHTPAFSDVVGTALEPMHWVSDSGAERLLIGWMTPNGFTFLGVGPLFGRVFGPGDATPDAPPVAVLNYRAWMRLFGGDPNVVGRSIVLNGQARTIIGIMPPRFEWNIADLWIPLVLHPTDESRLTRSYAAFQAKLRPGVSIEEAEAQLNVIAARRAAQFPNDYPPHSRMRVITVIDWVVGRFRGVLYTLFAAVSLLLVIACCNVAKMLLVRATARQREITIRAALGASRGRIVRQLLTESALLALGGVAAGCLLAYGGIATLAQLMPRQGIPWETQFRLDRPVLFFALATAALATFLFGLFPALQSARRELITAANSTGRSGTAGRRQTRTRSTLVVIEVAFSIILLLGAGLLMRSFLSLVSVDLGFDPRNLLVTGIGFPPAPPNTTIDRNGVYRDAVDRIHTIPGVRSVTVSNGFIGGMDTPIEVSGVSAQPGAGQVVFTSEEFVETLGIRLTAGRSISTLDVKTGHKVAVVSEKLVAQSLSGQDPLGRTVRLARLNALRPVPVADPTFTIIGVVSDVLNQGPREAPVPQVYVPYTVRVGASFTILVRTFTDPMAVVGPLRNQIQAIDRQIALNQPATAESILDRGIYAQPRFSLIVLGMFACTGLLLVALGVYGVLAYTVSERSQEIAIRMALGGERAHVLRLVFRMGLQLVGIGVLIGLPVGLATNRLLANQYWNTPPHDPITLVSGVLVIVVIGIFACWVPAHRAIRVEPIVALRHE
jgi:predicted permease